MTEFTKEVIRIIKSIPPGKVASYGEVADHAGNNRAARAVVYILRSYSKSESLPWHRIIGKTGQIRIKNPEGYLTQKKLLESEGIPVSDSGMVDMKIYGYYHLMDKNN